MTSRLLQLHRLYPPDASGVGQRDLVIQSLPEGLGGVPVVLTTRLSRKEELQKGIDEGGRQGVRFGASGAGAPDRALRLRPRASVPESRPLRVPIPRAASPGLHSPGNLKAEPQTSVQLMPRRLPSMQAKVAASRAAVEKLHPGSGNSAATGIMRDPTRNSSTLTTASISRATTVVT